MNLLTRFNVLLAILGLSACAAAEVEYLYYYPRTDDPTNYKGQYGYLFNKANFTNSVGEAKAVHANAICCFIPGQRTNQASVDAGSPTVYGMWCKGAVTPTISQGTLTFVAGGFGMKVENTSGSMSWYHAINISGTGDVVFDMGGSSSLHNQKAVTGTGGTIVKKGTGSLNLITDSPLRDFTIAGIRHEAGSLSLGWPKPRTTAFTYTFAGDGTTLSFSKTNLVFSALKIAETESVTGHTHGFSATAKALELKGLAADQGDFHGCFKGSLELLLALPNATDEFAVSGSQSTTTGDVRIRRGTLRLKDGATFTGTGNIFVEGAGATLAVDSDTVFTVRRLKLGSGGKVAVPEGVTVMFQLGDVDDERLADGTYTSGTCDWVSGAGAVRIGHAYENEIVLDVASGTQTITNALEAFNAATGESVTIDSLNGGADKARPLVKRGAGQLDMTANLANFTGAIHVEAGTLNGKVAKSLGTADASSPCWVYRGATYYCWGTANNFNSGRTFRIAGNGVNGRGALWLENHQSGNWGMTGFVASPFYLEDDATVGGNAWVSYGDAKLNGHTLVVTGGDSDTSKMFGTIYGEGHVVVSNTSLRGVGKFSATKPGNTITVLNGAEFRYWDTTCTFDQPAYWTMYFGNSTYRGDVGFGARGETANTITAPVVLNGTLQHIAQGDRVYGRLTYTGAISGSGTLAATWSRYTFWMMLRNAANTFTGGISFDKGILWPYCDGAIPAGEGCGPVTLTGTTTRDTVRADYDGVAFVVPGEYHLPELRVQGKYARRVQGGEGSWSRISKSGSNTLEYYTALGAATVEVTAGTLKLPRGAQPGLWEGTVACADAAAATTAFNDTATPSNRVLRGVYSTNKRERWHYSPTAANKVFTYSGYVWNRSNADQTLTLASSVKGAVKVKIDGEEKLTAAANQLVTSAVTLTPGPHAFEYRTTDATAYVPANWPKEFGFAVAPGSVDTSDTNVFQCVVDAGDGSFFTRTTNTTANLPAFGNVRLGAGAALDVNGNAFSVAGLSGAGSVTNSATDAVAAPALTVSSTFAVDGADLSADATLTTHVPLTFAAASVVTFTNVVTAPHGTYTLLRAAGDNTISVVEGTALERRLTASDPAERAVLAKWMLMLSADHKTLSLAYVPGTTFIVR